MRVRSASGIGLALRGAICAAATVCLFVGTAAGQSPEPSASGEDWARWVPGDARFYAELADLAEVRALFVRLGIWDLVVELSERNHPGATTRPWARRTQESLGLSSDDAVSRFLSRRAALFAVDSSKWQQGVLLGRLDEGEELDELLRQWSAQRLYEEGPVRCFRLRGALRLAVLGRTILLGPADDADGLWGRAVLLMAGQRGPNLAARSDFAALRSRLSANYPGLLYAQWSDNEPAVAGCGRLLVGFEVIETGIRSEWHGQLRQPTVRGGAISREAASPADDTVLATWTFRRDEAPGLPPPVRASLLERVASLAVAVLTDPDRGEEEFLKSIGPHYTFVLSREPVADAARRGEADAADLPVLSVIVDARNPADRMRQLDRVFGRFTLLFASMAEATDLIPRAKVQREDCDGAAIHHVELGPILARRLKVPALQGVEPAWAAVGDRLVISATRAQARALVRAMQAQEADRQPRSADAGKPSATAAGEADGVCERLEIRGAAAAKLMNAWLADLRQSRPEMMEASWWRTWAGDQHEKAGRLGVALINQPEHPGRALVIDLQMASPAWGLLEFDDIIVSAGGRPLPKVGAAQEVARRYQQRGGAGAFEVEVLRQGEPRRVVIPVSPAVEPDLAEFDPVLAMQRLSLLLSRAERVSFSRLTSRPDRLDARFTVTWQTSARR